MAIQDLKIDRSQKRGRGRRRGNPWFGRVLLLLVLGGIGWLFWQPLSSFVDSVRLPTIEVERLVMTNPAAAGAIRGTSANGHIVASRRAALSADTPGRIVELNVTEGSVVKEGELVARLYDEEYKAALLQAEAEFAASRVRQQRAEAAVIAAQKDVARANETRDAAHADVVEAEANRDLAIENFNRIQRLVQSGTNAAAELDTVRAQRNATAAALRAAEARFREAAAAVETAIAEAEVTRLDFATADSETHVREAARDLAAATLAKTRVTAPFDGIVVLKDAEVGEVVSPNSQGGSNARGSVCTMVDLQSLEAQAEVPESSLSAVAVGEPATIFLDAFPETPYSGRVDRIWPTANRQKATVEVRIAFDEPDTRLRPEMGLRIVFAANDPAAAAEPALLVSENAIIEHEGTEGVFVVERDVVQFAPAQFGSRRSGRAVVVDGLEAGQRIVLDPPTNLQPGDRVRERGKS